MDLQRKPNSGIMRSVRYLRPAHFELKIQSYSLLASIGVDKYESGVFEADGHNWRLAFYPRGKNTKKAYSHISLGLIIADTDELNLGWEINVLFKLFIKDQRRDEYLVVQADDDGRRFNATQTEWGFEDFLPMYTFEDDSNGYLVDDCCIFGAEVYVVQCSGKLECLTMLEVPPEKKFTWKIGNLQELDSELWKSESFAVGERNWKLGIYWKGKSGVHEGEHLALSLYLDDCESLSPNRKVFAEFTLRIRNQLRDINLMEKTVSTWFDSSTDGRGFADFILLSDQDVASKGYYFNNNLTAEAEFKVVSVIKDFK